MTSDPDRLLDMLGTLPSATPTVASTERLRARCHAALGRQPQVHTESRWTWLVLGVSLIYLAAALAQALTILQVL